MFFLHCLKYLLTTFVSRLYHCYCMGSDQLKYDQRGVSASKDEIHRAIRNLDKGLFPNAFCKIIPDIAGGDASWCNIMHADTAGTKTSLAYIYWRETGDLEVWKGIVEDAIVMNLDDMGCVGCLDNIVLSSTVGRNKHLIPGEVVEVIITHAQAFAEKLTSYGIGITMAGGETADVGDIVRTIDVGYTAFSRLRRSDVIDIDIRPGDIIVGFSSSGKATYETHYNGGMGSNGLTSARHDVFSRQYADKYPESYNPAVPENVVYAGSRSLTDTIQVNGEEMTVGKLVLSPTRTYLPLLKDIVEKYRSALGGIIHCSGGGQTKVGKFLKNPVHIVKDNVFEIPPLFRLIREESGLPLREMYQVFNMGHRLECYVREESAAQEMIAIASAYNIEAKVIGSVLEATTAGISIHAGNEAIYYEAS